jgi:AraC-like DNA-binding protein
MSLDEMSAALTKKSGREAGLMTYSSTSGIFSLGEANMTSVCWNMHDVAPAERFAYWREAVCQTYLPLEPEKLLADDFDGSLRSVNAAALQISRVNTVASSIRRTRQGISRFQDGSFFANLQIAGEAMVEQHGERRLARPGDIVLVDTNEPFAIHFAEGCNLICATVPGDRLRRHLHRTAQHPATVISGRGAGRVASAYLAALEDIPDDFDLIDDLAADQLGALLIRATATAAPESNAANRDLVPRILGFIADELHNPSLSAKHVCRSLQISRSHLFAVLAGAGMTFASHIRKERLRRSLNQLRDPRFADLPVGEIARRWGFGSPETFSRAFRHAYGVAPGAMRRRAEPGRG